MNKLINWCDFINGDQWVASYEQAKRDLHSLGCLRRLAARAAWWAGVSPEMAREISQVSKFLGVDKEIVMAAQVAYDEIWNLDGEVPLRGCTSVSERGQFGRNLDYGYPDNASEMVFHSQVPIDGVPYRIEGFAGLLGFLAITDGHSAVSINQAPKLRPLKRGRIPGLMWFRRQALDIMADRVDFSDEGDVWLADPPASDVLMHYVVGKKSYLAEVHDNQLMWRRMHGKVVQTNAYQLMDAPACPGWELDSQQRADAARSGKTLRASLKRAAVPGWTIDTFIK